MSIITRNPAADDENAPYFRRCAEFRVAVEQEAARRGLPYEPWTLPPGGAACPPAAAEAREARARRCPLCEAQPGTACRLRPSGDHLARYLDAYTAGQLTREFMAAVLGELVVVASWRIVPDGAA